MKIDKNFFKLCGIILLILLTILSLSSDISIIFGILLIFGIIYLIRAVRDQIKNNTGIEIKNAKYDNLYDNGDYMGNDGRIIINSIDDIVKSPKPKKEKTLNESKMDSSVDVMPYVLPKVSDYVTDKELASIISKQKIKVGVPVISNDVYDLIDLTDNCSMLINGSISSGKSSIIHSIINDILLHNKPSEVKFMIIDSKRLEYSEYNVVPHILCPVVTNQRKVIDALEKIVIEMERRYDELERVGSKNISGYNKMVELKNKESNSDLKSMPYIYLFIDELDDIVAYNKSIINVIRRMLEYARAVGINIICTTTTLSIKTFDVEFINSFNSIISFKIAAHRDARLLFENKESMNLKQYEFIYKDKGLTSFKIFKPVIFEKTNELIEYVFKQGIPSYTMESSNEIYVSDIVEEKLDTSDPMYKQIVEFVVTKGQASASLLQRRFHIGYNRAATYIDLLEERGIIGPQNGSKPREVIYKLENNNNDE